MRTAVMHDMPLPSNVTSPAAAVPDPDNVPPLLDQQLLLAAWQGDAAQVRAAVRLGASLLSVFRSSGGPAPHAAAAAEQGPLDQLQQQMEAQGWLKAKDYDGSTALHLAAHQGHVEVAELLLGSGARWDVLSKQRWLPLHAASYRNHVGVVVRLLQASSAPSHVDAATNRKHTALLLACSQGHGDVVSLLLAAGADPGITLGANGPPLLHLVARAGNLPVLQQLLAAMAAGQGTANANAVGPDGLTAVQWALRAGHLRCARALAAAGADVDLVPGVGMHPADTAKEAAAAAAAAAVHASATLSTSADQQLLLAAWKGDYLQLVEAIRLGASLESAYRFSGCIETHAAAVKAGGGAAAAAAAAGPDELQQQVAGVMLHPWLLDGSTALHLAAWRGQAGAAAALVMAGAPYAAVDTRNHWTPLHVATYCGHTAVMRVLLDAGASLHAACRMYGCTPLGWAASYGREAAVALLLAAGAPVNRPAQHRNMLPLHHSCQVGHRHVVELLLGSGAHFDVPDTAGWLPLHEASSNNHPGVVQRLLQASRAPAHVNAATNDGDTPLSLACRAGHGDVVSLLLAAGADPRHTLRNGDSLLHLVAGAGHLAVLQLLLRASAAGQGTVDVDAVGQWGETALKKALERRHFSCAEALIAAGADTVRLPGDPQWAVGGQRTLLHWVAQQGLAAAVPLLATQSNMSRRWCGRTPLEHALMFMFVFGTKHIEVVQALVAAGSPAAEAGADHDSAMTMAAFSNNPAIRALLPAMVRTECRMYTQLLEGEQQKQQQQKLLMADDGVGQQQEVGMQGSAALLAAVAEGMYPALRVSADAGAAAVPALGVACIREALEVLGMPAAGSCLQQLMDVCKRTHEQQGSSYVLQLVWALQGGWLAALQPLLEAKWHVVHPLQQMMSQAQLQQAGASGAAAGEAAAAAAAEGMSSQDDLSRSDPEDQAQTAANEGRWQEFVQHLEQLMGRQPGLASEVLCGVAEWQGGGRLGQLCEALLSAWWAARQTAAAQAEQEVVEAVVGAVLAWKEQQRGVCWQCRQDT